MPSTLQHHPISSLRPMPRRPENTNSAQQRSLIASTAAKLMAEQGISDFAQAKRKATQHLGLPENVNLPENTEVETELRLYQRLFQDEEQIERIAHLRTKACEVMAIMQRFNPYLTGSVLEGTAGRFAEIDIQLFTDSAKDVEIFLLNQRIDFSHSQPRSDRVEAVLTLHSDDTDINLVIYPAHAERVTLKTRDGRSRRRARLDAVKKLLAEEQGSSEHER